MKTTLHVSLVLFIFFFSAATLSAQQTALDSSFSEDGITTTFDPMGATGSKTITAIQHDGKILVAATSYDNANPGFAILRFMADGTVDNSFGVNGKATVSFSNIAGADQPSAMQVLADGKILIAGTVYDINYAPSGNYYNFGLAKLNANGSLDNSFGTGGKVSTSLSNYDKCNGMAVQPDGKILLAVITTTVRSNNWTVILRYNSNGSLDLGFGSKGLASSRFNRPKGSANAAAIALQPDGKIVTSGNTESGLDILTIRFKSNGKSVDSSFGINGGVITRPSTINNSSVHSIVIQADNSILIAGNTTAQGALLMRYTATGVLDNSMGSAGISHTLVSGYNSTATGAIILQGDGKIVAAAAVSNNNGSYFSALRFTANGSLDAEFGNNGVTITDFEKPSQAANSLAIQPDGNIVVAGMVSDASQSFVAVARYKQDIILPIKFGTISVSEISINKNIYASLQWTTISEINSKYFAIERSTDGRDWKDMAHVNSKAANGNSSLTLSYTHNDNINALNGNFYYRIKQVDLDGKSSYSGIVLLKRLAIVKAIVNVWPNPVVNGTIKLHIQTPAAQKVSIRLIDINGNVLYTKAKLDAIAGDNLIEINATGFAKAATYYIEVINIETKEKTGTIKVVL